MKRLTLLLLFAVGYWQLAVADTTKPWTFWYWMYGAVTEEGIKAALDKVIPAKRANMKDVNFKAIRMGADF